jgi:hypothetical protein
LSFPKPVSISVIIELGFLSLGESWTKEMFGESRAGLSLCSNPVLIVVSNDSPSVKIISCSGLVGSSVVS